MPNEYIDAGVTGERIYKSLVHCITNIKVMAALKQLTRNDWDHLKTMMEPLDFLAVVGLGKKYFDSESLPFCSICTGPKSQEEVREANIDLEIGKVQQIFKKYRQATEFVLTFPVDEPVQIFLHYMEDLCISMKEKISKTPQDEKKYVQNLQQLYSQNTIMLERIGVLQAKIDALEAQNKAIIKAKQKEITTYQLKTEALKEQTMQKVKEIIAESEEQMESDWRQAEYQHNSLITEVKAQTISVENLVKERLAKEKDLRKKRFKIESHLVSLLSKYDLDIGERQKQKEELLEKLEEETLELNELQERYDEQQVEHDQLVHNKYAYEQCVLMDKLRAIRQRMAARTIQRAFRKYLRRRRRPKKKDKDKGKKKKK